MRSVVLTVLVICVVAGVGAAMVYPEELAGLFSGVAAPFRHPDPVVGCWESQVARQAAIQCFAEDGGYTSLILGLPGTGRWERLSERSVRVENTTLAFTAATTFDMWLVEEALHMQQQGEREVGVFVRTAGATALEAQRPPDPPLADERAGQGAAAQAAARQSERDRLRHDAERAQQEAREARAQLAAAQAEAAQAVAAARERQAREVERDTLSAEAERAQQEALAARAQAAAAQAAAASSRP